MIQLLKTASLLPHRFINVELASLYRTNKARTLIRLGGSVLLLLLANTLAVGQSSFRLSFGVSTSNISVAEPISQEIQVPGCICAEVTERQVTDGQYNSVSPSLSLSYSRQVSDNDFSLGASLGVQMHRAEVFFADGQISFSQFYDAFTRLSFFSVPIEVFGEKLIADRFLLGAGIGVTYISPPELTETIFETPAEENMRAADANFQYSVQGTVGYVYNRFSIRGSYSKGLGWWRADTADGAYLLNPMDVITVLVGYEF